MKIQNLTNIRDKIEIEAHYQLTLGDYYAYESQKNYRRLNIQKGIELDEMALKHRIHAKNLFLEC